jgi:hypothetical protein
LDTFLTIKNAQGVKSISEDFENDLQIYVKLFTILYADDTVLLAESTSTDIVKRRKTNDLGMIYMKILKKGGSREKGGGGNIVPKCMNTGR